MAEMLAFDGEYTADHPKEKFWCLSENSQKVQRLKLQNIP